MMRRQLGFMMKALSLSSHIPRFEALPLDYHPTHPTPPRNLHASARHVAQDGVPGVPGDTWPPEGAGVEVICGMGVWLTRVVP